TRPSLTLRRRGREKTQSEPYDLAPAVFWRWRRPVKTSHESVVSRRRRTTPHRVPTGGCSAAVRSLRCLRESAGLGCTDAPPLRTPIRPPHVLRLALHTGSPCRQRRFAQP